MKGKICMVTGATSGIGKATAQALAEMGATVLITGRDERKTKIVVDEIIANSGNKSVDCMLADFSSQEQVRNLAEMFEKHYDRLNVLVNNAGAIFYTRDETIDGIERTFATNHLAPFLLTLKLLNIIKQSAPARIVNVSSVGHRNASLDFTDLQNKRKFNGLDVYRQSKLANVLFTYELARRLKGTGVTVNAVDPGMVKTNIGVSNKELIAIFQRIIHRSLAVPVEKGAQTSIFAASSQDIAGVTGAYFADCKAVHSSDKSYDEETAKRLWRISEELTEFEM